MSDIPENIDDLTYEQALVELEEIIAGLEGEDQTLEQAISRYERGQRLAQHCARLLDQAELRMRSIDSASSPESA